MQQQAPQQQQGQHQQQGQQQGSAGGLSAPSMPASNVRLRQGVLDLIKATFAAPGSPFAADKFVSGRGARGLLAAWGGRPKSGPYFVP